MTEFELIEETSACYLAGALPDEEAGAFEDRVAAGWNEGTAALFGLRKAVRSLVADVASVEPPARIKNDLLARITSQAQDVRAADRKGAAKIPGFAFKFSADGGFEPSGHPGMWVRLLNVDQSRKQFTCLVRLDPGAEYPSHAHDGPEECIVLEGEIRVGEVQMKAGDYQRAEPGTDHVRQWSETGALLYLTAPLSLMA